LEVVHESEVDSAFSDHPRGGLACPLVVRVVQEEANLKAAVNERLERRDVNVRGLVEALVGDLRPLADATNLTLINAIPEGLAAFAAAAGMLSLIFQNLISNAINYTPKQRHRTGSQVRQKEGTIVAMLQELSDSGAHSRRH
jgi:signal transduction histidine kinase